VAMPSDQFEGKTLNALTAHNDAMSLPIGEVVRRLVGLLGATTVAAIGNVQETRAVQQWMAGREPQRPHVLRFALQIASMISTVATRELAVAWFYGANPHLDDQAPIAMLRGQTLELVQGRLLAATRLFVDRDLKA
jgi:hypothetical protein